MGTMELKDLFDLLKTYEDTNLTLWNIYIGVIFGLLGYVVGTEKNLGRFFIILMIVGFIIFSFGNLRYLERNQGMIYALSSEISATDYIKEYHSIKFTSALKDMQKNQVETLMYIHVPVDVLVVLFLWFSPYIRKRFKLHENQTASA